MQIQSVLVEHGLHALGYLRLRYLAARFWPSLEIPSDSERGFSVGDVIKFMRIGVVLMTNEFCDFITVAFLRY